MKLLRCGNLCVTQCNTCCKWDKFSNWNSSEYRSIGAKITKLQAPQTKFYKEFKEGITTVGLKIKNKPAFQPVSEDFELKWNSIIFNAEQSIVQLLLYELEKVIRRIEVEIQKVFNEKSPEKLKQRYADLEKKHSDFQSKLEQRWRKKLKKFKKRYGALNNTKEIITGVGRSEVPSSVMQLSTVNKLENVPLVELATTTPKHNESSNITDKVVNVCTSTGLKIAETPGIDDALATYERSQ